MCRSTGHPCHRIKQLSDYLSNLSGVRGFKTHLLIALRSLCLSFVQNGSINGTSTLMDQIASGNLYCR